MTHKKTFVQFSNFLQNLNLFFFIEKNERQEAKIQLIFLFSLDLHLKPRPKTKYLDAFQRHHNPPHLTFRLAQDFVEQRQHKGDQATKSTQNRNLSPVSNVKKYQPSDEGHLLTACNAVPPATLQ